FDIARIIAEKKPKASLLENVKNLMSHDKGNTFRVIRETLENELKYEIHTKVIDGKHFVPQHRERIIIVGFKDETDFTWEDLDLPPKGTKTLKTILHPQNGTEKSEEPYTLGEIGLVNPKYTLSKKLWDYLQAYAEKHKNAGNGFGYGLVTENATARTLSARYYKDGAEILVSQGDDKCPRRLTPRECARLMGFPPDFKIPVSDNQAYKQFGNSVVVPVIFEVARIMLPHVLKNKTNPNIKKKVIKPKASSDAIRRTMQSNRGKNTKPELLLRKALFKHGLKGYRIHYKKLPGKPDICFTKYKIAIFINGCFWHRCPICKPNIPKHNSEFWEDKFNQTILRDKKINKQLTTLGWKVLVIWECEIKKNIDHQVEKIRNTI
ncbi:MAG: DNA mismatch endonuclease Vsr, partial [Candidatus Cloacimonetes bacterium]|nr:DNA mismatch endonuclease Vsr [Candidatus Cloacimonadota bacterium]